MANRMVEIEGGYKMVTPYEKITNTGYIYCIQN